MGEVRIAAWEPIDCGQSSFAVAGIARCAVVLRPFWLVQPWCAEWIDRAVQFVGKQPERVDLQVPLGL